MSLSRGMVVRIYVSHASEDNRLAEYLVRRLAGSPCGFSVVSSGGFAAPDSGHEPSLPSALAHADAVVALVTSAYLATDGAHDQEIAALKALGAQRVLPVVAIANDL